MPWSVSLHGNPIDWLFEPSSPGVRYLALRDLLDSSTGDKDFLDAREQAHRQGPIASILSEMEEQGYWVEPGLGYRPNYQSTVWSLVSLAQLEAVLELDDRLCQACHYLMDQALTEGGHFITTGTPPGTADCLQGNLCFALLEVGYADKGLEAALEWMARSVTGEGFAPSTERQAPRRYFAGRLSMTTPARCGSSLVK